VTEFTDDGGTSTLVLDGLGRTREAIYDDGDLTVSYDYGTNGVESDWTEIDSASTGIIGRQFTEGGQLAGWTREVDGVTQTTAIYRYDNGRLDEEEDPFGNITKYTYDEFGRTEKIKDLSTGAEVVYTYDAVGRVLTETRSYTDASGPRSETTTYTYDIDDQGPTTVKDPLGYITEFDVDGTVSTVRSPLTDLGGGNLGEISGVTRTTQVVRNAAGLPIAYINADGSQTTIGYRNSDTLGDAEQFPTFVRDESGRERRFTYDDQGRLETSTDLGGVVTSFSYQDVSPTDNDPDLPEGGRREVVDLPGPASVTYLYNEDGRLIKIERPGFGDYEVLDLDTTGGLDFTPDGQPLSVLLSSGETVEMTYDDIGRMATRKVTSTSMVVTENVEFVYDPASDNLVRTVDLLAGPAGTNPALPTGGDEAVYVYYSTTNPQEAGASHAGKLEKIVYPSGASVRYQYDALGRVIQLFTKPVDTGPDEYSTSYEYNQLGNLWKVHDPFGGTTTYNYDELGRLKNRTLPNGVFTTWTFDNRDRLTLLAHYESDGGTIISSFAYEHPTQAVGEPSRITQTDDTGNITYIKLTYDPALRLEREEYFNDVGNDNNDANDTLIRTIEYSYDAQGNRTLRTEDSNVDTYNINTESGYELDSITGANPATFGYDTGGRLISLVRGATNASLDYNSSGQLISVDNASGADPSFEFDALGRRTRSNDGTTSRNYLIAPAAQRLGAGVLDVEVQHLATQAGGGPTTGWIYAGENPILRFEGAPGAEQVSYYLEDASDSIRALLDAAGNVVQQYNYDAFGNTLAGSDLPSSAAGGDFGYQAAWRDDATELYYMRARTYEGRFLTPDPADGVPQAPETYNLYAFANNNPHLYSDPTGLFSVTEISVSINISNNLQSFKAAAVQNARKFATDEIEELAVNFLVNKLSSLLPSFGGADPSSLIRSIGAADVGTLFQDSVNGVLEKLLPFPDGVWIEPSIDVSGKVVNAGLNRNNPEGFKTFGTKKPRPDYLINRTNPKSSNAGRTWLVGDISLSGNGIYKKYVDPGKQINQWNAITNHAKNFGIRISTFFTFFEGGSHVAPAIKALISEKAFKDGTFVFIISLKD